MKFKSLMFVAVLATAILCFGATTKASTIADLQAQIAQLMTQLKTMQSQQGTATAWCYTFNKNLGVGMDTTNPDVSPLVTALYNNGIINYEISENGYDEQIASAVIKFQQKYGITPLSGYVGPKTRAKLNALYACASSAPKTCVDSDSGLNYYLKGQASIPVDGPGHNPQSLDDECQGNTLTEAYCSNGGITSTSYVCSNGCLNGACVQLTTQPSITVTSPAAGANLQVGQAYTVRWTESPAENVTYTLRDVVNQQVATVTSARACNAGTCSFAWIPAQTALNDNIAVSDYTNSAYGSSGFFSVLSQLNQSLIPSITSISPTSATGGQQVTVNGSNFISGTTVTLSQNGALSTYSIPTTIIASNQLTFVLSGLAYANMATGVYQLSVVNSNGTSNLLNFTVSSTFTQPTITSISPTSGPAGATVVVHGGGFNIPWGNGLNPDYINMQIRSVIAKNFPPVSVSSDGTQMTFVVPNDFTPATYDVEVVGSVMSNSVPFTITTTTSTTQPAITVMSPNGGESFKIGDNLFVLWNDVGAESFPSTILQLVNSSGAVISSARVNPISGNQTSEALSTGGVTAGSYKVKVCLSGNIDICDSSDNYFSIVAPTPPTGVTCSPITINGVTYSLDPCTVTATMADGQGNKNFSTTLTVIGGNSSGVHRRRWRFFFRHDRAVSGGD